MAKKYKLALQVERSFLETKDPNLRLPVLKLTDWAKFVITNNCWHVLVGLNRPHEKREEDILEAFWSMYRQQCPNHAIFRLAESGELLLRRTCPIVFHGDEGRGRKHKAYLVFSWRSLLGKGLEPGEHFKRVHHVRKPYLKQLCNYKGHSFTTRFMMAGLRKEDYTGSQSHVFGSLMSFGALQANEMARAGVTDIKGKRFWMACLYMTGDWPWLHTSGNFSWSFHNCPKFKNQRNFKGICHECRAGQDGVDFEQLSTTRPRWLQTEHEQSPFSCPSPWSIVPHDEGRLASMWIYDFFHTFHLGVAKNLCGGALALLSMQENGSTVDERFEALSARYKGWCLRNKYRAHIQKISKECIGWLSTRHFPCGTWHKGELSCVLMRFLEATLTEQDFSQSEPMLTQVKEAVVAINAAIRIMYGADLWLSRTETRAISGHGLRFLRRFEELALQGQRRGLNLWMIPPKMHCLQKIFLRVHFAWSQNKCILNPLATSVQQCEDFIGRPSRLSRRVAGGQKATERVLDRYLLSCYPHWVRAGYLIRPEWSVDQFSIQISSISLETYWNLSHFYNIKYMWYYLNILLYMMKNWHWCFLLRDLSGSGLDQRSESAAWGKSQASNGQRMPAQGFSRVWKHVYSSLEDPKNPRKYKPRVSNLNPGFPSRPYEFCR